MKFVNFLVLNTSWNVKKIVDFMEKENFDAVFLNLPQKFEPFIRKNQIPYDPVYEQDFRALSPLIEFCKSSGIRIYCYKDDKNGELESSCNYEILKLVLRAKTGRIVVEDWKRVLRKQIMESRKFVEYEGMRLIENADEMNACINLSLEIEDFLRSEGFTVDRVELYGFSRPIDKLFQLVKLELDGATIDEAEFGRYIREHIAFIDAVVELGYEEACKFLFGRNKFL